MATNIQIHRVDDETWKQDSRVPSHADVVDGCKWLLDSLVKSSPPGPAVPSSEPEGLNHLVYCQIEYLKRRRSSWFVIESVEKSIDAVLHAYRTGQLQAEPGLISYWWNGHMARGPERYPVEDLAESAKEWTGLYGKGQVHIERLSREWVPQQASVAIYPAAPAPANLRAIPPPTNHMLGVRVTLPSLPNSRTRTQFTALDDTGSNFLELFGEDCAALGFDPRNIPPEIYVDVIDLVTVNGTISVPCIKVGIQFVSPNDVDIGDLITAMAVCANDWYAIRDRCSGQALRSTFFTANAPFSIGGGDMVVGTHKSIVTNNVPGRARS
ncbi:hypothetical protein PHISCL_02559 [Aspergillus sclerotialis]|uniref:Uncharacterized protein n=1 Tax=Aspergillus sclerotialis TaxID=2070753 RepID=A0A3A2ZPI4_9EURO|nr:hypothetical protein PHISCL_02559 [Aspergillus sclerotialis]